MALALLTLLAYAPATDGDFLWDDDAHVTRPELRSPQGLWRIWFDLGATQQYYPVLHSAFWVEHAVWGNDAATGRGTVGLSALRGRVGAQCGSGRTGRPAGAEAHTITVTTN